MSGSLTGSGGISSKKELRRKDFAIQRPREEDACVMEGEADPASCSVPSPVPKEQVWLGGRVWRDHRGNGNLAGRAQPWESLTPSAYPEQPGGPVHPEGLHFRRLRPRGHHGGHGHCRLAQQPDTILRHHPRGPAEGVKGRGL